ncbi:MAG: hypothetical protein ACREST_00765 [Steroidobacteraceae bacterium]
MRAHEQDVMTAREIPATRFVAIAWLMIALVAASVAAWEWKMRSLGLTTRDLDDSRSHWAVERRKVGGAEDDGVVIIGSSRILWDTNLDVWEEMTGLRPIQLALPGTNPRQFLEDFANDGSFDDFVVVGVTPDLYFGDWPGIPQFSGLTKFWRDESPSQRFGHRVGMLLERGFAFLDGAYSLGKLIDRLPVRDRAGVRGPVRDVWKIWDVGPDRQHYLWSRIQSDERLREHARWVWGPFDGKAVPAEEIARAIEQSRRDIAKIRARGGDVVFVRSPSAGLYYEHELRAVPRAKTWDPLLAQTEAFGIHFEDHPAMQGLDVPEWSHLSRDSAVTFTRAYVSVLQRRYPRLRNPHD